jgi:hypothetical protein
MISSQTEYQKARDELGYLNRWLSRLEDEKATANKCLTTASIRKMIARLQEELAEFEAASISISPRSEKRTEPNRGEI